MRIARAISLHLLVLVFGVLTPTLLTPTLCHAQTATPVDEKVERMLSAIGGRAAWAGLQNTINDSQQNRLDDPTVVRAVIAMDFTRPRFRIDTSAPGLQITRVIDGDRHWRLTRKGTIEDVPENIVKEDHTWYAAHVYRTLHRIAARDAVIRLALGKQDRIEVYEGEKRIAWYATDARGEPFAFGAHADDVGSICGPWDFSQGAIRHPTWVARPDGTWRAAIKSLSVNAPLTDSLFVRPESFSEHFSDVSDTTRWKLINVDAKSITLADKAAVHLVSHGDSANGIIGLALPSGKPFRTGVIEVDLKGKNLRGNSFLGIAFNVTDDKQFEAIYFRPFNFHAAPPFQTRGVQYIAWPGNTWEHLRKTHPEKFENRVSNVPNPDDWFHARIEIDERRVSVFVNHASEPALVVDRLAASDTAKPLGLFVDTSDGYYANLRVTHLP